MGGISPNFFITGATASKSARAFCKLVSKVITLSCNLRISFALSFFVKSGVAGGSTGFTGSCPAVAGSLIKK